MKLNGFAIFLCVALISTYQPAYGQASDTAEKKFAEWRAKAEKGDAEAQFTVGYFYQAGEGVAQDETEGVKWYRKAADQNLATAQFNMGTCYEKGQGVSKDMVEAVRWYKKSADQNFPDAQFNLGQCYMHGEGVTSNAVEAVKLYRKAAEQKLAAAQYNLGRCYLRALGVAQDPSEGYKWCFLASSQGNDVAINTVAKLDTIMSSAEIAEGKRRANDWLKQHP